MPKAPAAEVCTIAFSFHAYPPAQQVDTRRDRLLHSLGFGYGNGHRLVVVGHNFAGAALQFPLFELAHDLSDLGLLLGVYWEDFCNGLFASVNSLEYSLAAVPFMWYAVLPLLRKPVNPFPLPRSTY